MFMSKFLFIALGAIAFWGIQEDNAGAMAKTEEQPYKVVLKKEKFEIRYYPEAVFATVRSSGDGYRSGSSNQFRRLAGFIFGGNSESRQIPMTAPVYMEKTESGNTMHFVMPKAYSLETLPRPLDSGIEIAKSKPGHYAAYVFGGFANEEKILKAEAELRELLRQNGIKTTGNFKYLGYNAPYEVFNRRNEVVVAIEYEPVAN
jgi:hypothetical protein